MTASVELRSGKSHRDENFPVASWLIAARHRPAILAFYEFVRVADDIADHPSLRAGDKLVRLERLEQSLLGGNEEEPDGVALRDILTRRKLSFQHARDLLRAFRQDVTQHRYRGWSDLVDYCAYSAMPVGRFVLDVHGEARSTWPASDALCAALQIINHLQDCADDYRALGRVYLPLDDLASHGLGVEALAGARASPALRACIGELAQRTERLLAQSRPLPRLVTDTRLALEISVIQALAARQLARLKERDPLGERVRLSKAEMAAFTVGTVGHALWRRLFRVTDSRHRYQTP
ncbi:MAG TPA: squalene synthase HpnC [Pseudolabrys sp.]|nr:squalene synthase HpnC [Pseudolabrys sp.]